MPAPSDRYTGDRKRYPATSLPALRSACSASRSLLEVPKNHKANNHHKKGFRRTDTLEPAFRERVVVGDIGPIVGLQDPQLALQLADLLRPPSGRPVAVDR